LAWRTQNCWVGVANQKPVTPMSPIVSWAGAMEAMRVSANAMSREDECIKGSYGIPAPNAASLHFLAPVV
jgi:hypothetical protein